MPASRVDMMLATHEIPLFELERRLASLRLTAGFIFEFSDHKETHIHYKNPNMAEIDNRKLKIPVIRFP